MSIKLIKHQVIPLRKSVKRSKIVCSFKDGLIIPINNALRFFLTWLLDGALYNMDQSNKCPIWFFICCAGPLSVTFSDIFMIKMENDIVIPMKPIFYCRYVDDIYTRRKKNIEDSLFKALNSYHKNIKLTIEINPIKFLDTHLQITI